MPSDAQMSSIASSNSSSQLSFLQLLLCWQQSSLSLRRFWI